MSGRAGAGLRSDGSTGADGRRRALTGRRSRDSISLASVTAPARLPAGRPPLATSWVPPGCTRGPLATGAATLPQAASNATAARTKPTLIGTLMARLPPSAAGKTPGGPRRFRAEIAGSGLPAGKDPPWIMKPRPPSARPPRPSTQAHVSSRAKHQALSRRPEATRRQARTLPHRARRQAPCRAPARGRRRRWPRLRQHRRLRHSAQEKRLDLAGHVDGIRPAAILAAPTRSTSPVSAPLRHDSFPDLRQRDLLAAAFSIPSPRGWYRAVIGRGLP
jgi:hypothetical protein